MLPETERLELEDQLKHDILSGGVMPRHVAVIMDGNGRWAKRRRRPRVFGHLAGRHAVREVVRGSRELGIEVLTLYTFSVENWQRPSTEVSALMRILQQTLGEQRQEMKEKGIRLAVLGRLEDLPPAVQDTLHDTMDFLAGGRDMVLNLALSYGGRPEIVRAARRLAALARDGKIDPDRIDEAAVARQLYTEGLPDPDLLIRTSGEFRISNFLIWQAAYSEIWVTDVLWPDFRRRHLLQAIGDYQKRERRYGGITTA
jgi:undecaprenyl diphosphate synthase